MSLVKKLLDWNEEKFNEIDVTEDKHPYVKAFMSGAVNGYVDSAVILYPMVLASAYYWMHKATKK